MNDFDGQFLRLLRHVFGNSVQLNHYRLGNQLPDYQVLIAELSQPSATVVIKLAGPNAPFRYPFERTAAIHHLVAQHTTIPMPEVIAVDSSCTIFSWRYLIMTYTPGQEWAHVRNQMSQQQLADAHRQIGDATAQLHRIPFGTFGELADDATVSGTRDCVTALQARSQNIIRNPRLRDLFLEVLDSKKHLFLGVNQAALCHEDLHQHNILFQQQGDHWHLATILDFDKAWAGHHESDLARLSLWRGMVSEEFWRAYQSVHLLDPLFHQRRALYQLWWCLEYANPTPEHLADTQQVCIELGIEPIKRFE